jgi:hypothetical protein
MPSERLLRLGQETGRIEHVLRCDVSGSSRGSILGLPATEDPDTESLTTVDAVYTLDIGISEPPTRVFGSASGRGITMRTRAY